MNRSDTVIKAAAALAVSTLAAAACAPPSTAAPPGFPDLAALSAVDSQPYVATTKGSAVVGALFSTPFGYVCEMSNQGGRPAVSCSGKQLPGHPSNPPAFCGDKVAAGGGPAVFSPGQGSCGMEGVSKPLNPGQKIVYAGMTCGVGQDFTACTTGIDAAGEHGFALRQDGADVLF